MCCQKANHETGVIAERMQTSHHFPSPYKDKVERSNERAIPLSHEVQLRGSENYGVLCALDLSFK